MSGPMRVTPEGILYLLLVVVALAAAVASGGAAGPVAVACVLAAVGAWSAWAVPAARRALQSRLEAPDSAFAGERAPVAWVVENRSGWFALRIERAVLRAVHPRAGYRLEAGAGAVVPPGGRVRLSMLVPCRHRGEVRLEEATLEVTGVLPLVRMRAVQPIGAQLTVYPRPAVLRRELPEPEGERSWRAERAPWAWARGVEEFLAVREYVPGDSPRRVHWRWSSRVPGSWRVKEFAALEAGEATVLLEGQRPKIAAGLRWRADWERAVAAAGAVCRALVERGWTVRLVLPQETVAVRARLEPAYRALAVVEPREVPRERWEELGEMVIRISPHPEGGPAGCIQLGPEELRSHFAYL